VQAHLVVEKLTLVNQKPRIDIAILDRIDDVVKRDDDVLEIPVIDL
jgi:hypothetical protein